jgi:hypothetical protein
MMPGSVAFAAPAIVRAVDEEASDRTSDRTSGRGSHRRPALSRVAHTRMAPWILAAVVTVVAVAATSARVGTETAPVATLQAQLASAKTQLATATQASADTLALRTRIAELKGQIARLREAKIRTVVEETTVTQTVTEWVPSGAEVSVEVTGFEGRIELQDVQLTHAYGFSDLIGIAVNTSGETISYGQLGCTFVDEEGRVVANAIDNKQEWLPDQTWGFSCSAQVRATGGVLRVDEAA